MLSQFQRPGFNPWWLKSGLFLLWLLISTPVAQAIPHPDYSFDVYEVPKASKWREGPRILIIGGIHGDEPGGYLAAEYALDGTVSQGKVHIIPRINKRAIILNYRGFHADMNRLFRDDIEPSIPEEYTVRELIRILPQYDYVLSLHDGSGYYHPTYIDSQRNPLRYGQSIIIDTDVYEHTRHGNVCLQCIADEVVAHVNAHKIQDGHRFHVSNHETASEQTSHVEQRTSLTYYTLTRLGIPAFCSEASKLLPDNAHKVYYHMHVIDSFLQATGVGYQAPEHDLASLNQFLDETRTLRAVEIFINDEPRMVPPSARLHLRPGDTIAVGAILGDRKQPWFPDIYGTGNYNDRGITHTVDQETKIVIRSDNQDMGTIQVRLADEPVEYFEVVVDGEQKTLRQGEIVHAHRSFEVLTGTGRQQSDSMVNVQGYVPPGLEGKVPDDRSYALHPKELDWRFSVHRQGLKYRVHGFDDHSYRSTGEVYFTVDDVYGR